MKLLDVIEVEDEPNMKHEESMRKRPIPRAPTVEVIGFDSIDQHMTHRESEG